MFSSQMNSIFIQMTPHLPTEDIPLRGTLVFIPNHPCPTSAHPVTSARPLWYIGVSQGILLAAPICPGERGPGDHKDMPQPA